MKFHRIPLVYGTAYYDLQVPLRCFLSLHITLSHRIPQSARAQGESSLRGSLK